MFQRILMTQRLMDPNPLPHGGFFGSEAPRRPGVVVSPCRGVSVCRGVGWAFKAEPMPRRD